MLRNLHSLIGELKHDIYLRQQRNYVLGDDELAILGDREKLAQWRHKGVGPAFYRLGRKIVFRGSDLNDWADAQRVEPSAPSVR